MLEKLLALVIGANSCRALALFALLAALALCNQVIDNTYMGVAPSLLLNNVYKWNLIVAYLCFVFADASRMVMTF